QAARLPVLDVLDARGFEKRAVAGNDLREAEQVAIRIELRLVGEPQRAAHRERQLEVVEPGGGEPELGRGGGLVLERLRFFRGLGVHVRRQRLEPATELEGFAQLADAADGAFVRRGIATRARLADTVEQAPVTTAVLGRRLGGGAPRRLAADAARLE